MTKVSILLAVYNGELYLDEALESVCKQTFKEWELLAVENGSSDSTLKILEYWSALDKRIKVFTNTTKGKNRAFNRAFKESSAKFICFLAADDILPPMSLERRIRELIRNPQLDYSTCLLETISKDVKFNGLIFPQKRKTPNFSGGSIFFVRHIADKIFPLPEDLPNEDVWTSLHLKNFGNGIHISESLYLYRIHSNNSYGYHSSFALKREGFLKRMIAFDLFLEKYNNELSHEKVAYLGSFCSGRQAAERKKLLKILFIKLPLKDKVIFLYFCSPFLFWLKQRFIKYFSGKIELV